MAISEALLGKRVYIRRDGEDDGFDGVITDVKDNFVFVAVADPNNEVEGIWVNISLQREIQVYTNSSH